MDACQTLEQLLSAEEQRRDITGGMVNDLGPL